MKIRVLTIVVYLVGFTISLGSYALLVQLGGNKGSNLSWLVVVISEFIRHAFGSFSGSAAQVFSLPSITASGITALAFPATFLLLTSGRKYLRLTRIGFALLLCFVTLYWFQTPLDRF